MATQRLFTRMRKAAQNDDELWDADAEQRVRESTERINRENLEKYGTENPTTEDITGVPLHPENAPMITPEQGYQYANQQLNMLNDNQKSTLQDWVDDLKAYLTQTQTNAQNKNPFGDFVGSDSSVKLAERAQEEKQALIDSGMPDVSHDNVDNMRQWREYQEYVNDYEDRQKQQEELKDKDLGELFLDEAFNATMMPYRSFSALAGALDRPLDREHLGINTNSDSFFLQNLNEDVTNERRNKLNEYLEGVNMPIGSVSLGNMNHNQFGDLVGGVEKPKQATDIKSGDVVNNVVDAAKMGAENVIGSSVGTGVAEALGLAGKVGNAVATAISVSPYFGEGYSQEIKEAQDRGLTEDEAEKLAFVSGSLEAVTEILPDYIRNKAFGSIGKKLGKEFVEEGAESIAKYLAKQTGSEMSEELINDVAYTFADNIITGDKSVYNTNKKKYMDEGMSEEDATKQARIDWAKDTAKDMAVAGLSSLLTGGGTAVVNSYASNMASKPLEGNYKEIAQAIPDNVEDYNSEEDYNKAMEVKARAEELDTQDKVSSADRTGLLQDIYAVNETMPNTDLIENINESVNSPFADVGGFQVAKNDITSQEVAQSMAQANNVNDFVEAYRDSQASSNVEARQTGQEYFETLAPKFDTYDEGSRPLDLALTQRSAEDLYTAALNGEEVNQEELNTTKKQQLFQRGMLENTVNQRAEAQRQARREEQKTFEPTQLHNIETPQGKADIADITLDNEGNFKWTKGDEEVIVPRKDISDNAMQRFMVNALNQPTLSAKQLYIDNYDGSIPIGSYNNAYESAFNAGQLNSKNFKGWLGSHKFYARSIPESTLEAFFNEGAKQVENKSKKVTSAKTKGTGKVTAEKSVENTPIHKLAQAFASRTGIDVEIRDGSILVTDGAQNALTDAEGNEIYSNGQFQADISKVIVGANGKELQTFMHEAIGEVLEAYNPEDMADIQDAILNYLLESKGDNYVDKTIKRYQRLYTAAEGAKSYRDAANEMVNDTLVGLFTTDKGANDFVNWCTKNDKSVLEKITDFIQAIIDKLKSLISDANLSSEARTVAEMSEKQAQKIRDRLFKAMDKAIDNYKGAEEGKADTSNRNSLDNLENKTRFALAEPVEQKGNLIAVHNRSVQDMLYAIEQGGIAMPSIAVTKADMLHTNFGDVSVLYPSEVIDPQYADNYVYSGDAYTPITPRVEYKTNEDMVRDFGREVKEITKKLPGLYNSVSFYEVNYQDRLNSTGSMYEVFKGNPAVIYAYLKEKNIPIRTPYKDNVYDETKEMAERLLRHYTLEELKSMSEGLSKEKNLEVLNVLNQDRLNEYLKDHTQEEYDELPLFEKNMISMYDEEYHPSVRTENEIKDVVKYKTNGAKKVVDYDTLTKRLNKKINKANEEDYKQWLSSKLDKAVIKKQYRNNKDYYTRSGNPRSWNQLHDDYTLDNAIRIMREGAEKGEGQFGYNIFGSSTVNYGSIDEIHADEDRLQERDYEEYKQLRSDINDELYRIANHIKPSTSWDVSSAAKDIAEAVATRKTKQGIKNWLSEWYNVEDSDIDDIMDLVQEVREMPTTYFEAKPQRAVTLDEIAKVVVPSDATELITALEENNIPYNTYERDNEDSRREAVNSAVEEKDIRFSLDVPTTYALDEDLSDEELKELFPGTDDDMIEYKDSKNLFVNTVMDAASKVLDFNISDSQVNQIAKWLIDTYNSEETEEYISRNLRNIFSGLKTNNYEDMVNALQNLTEEVAEKAKEVDPDDKARYDSFIKSIPSFRFSEYQVQEMNNRDIYKNVFGKIGFKTNANSPTLDGNLYWEICDAAQAHGYTMKREVSDLDQIDEISKAIDYFKPQSKPMFEGADITDGALESAREIMRRYFKYAQLANQTDDSLKEVQRELKRQTDEYKQKVGKIYQEQVKQLREELSQLKDEKKLANMQGQQLYERLAKAENKASDSKPSKEEVKQNFKDFSSAMPKFRLTDEQRKQAIEDMGAWNSVWGRLKNYMNKDAQDLDDAMYKQIVELAKQHGFDGMAENTDHKAKEIIRAIAMIKNPSYQGDNETIKKLSYENWQLNTDLQQAQRMALRDKKSLSRKIERMERNKHLKSIRNQAIRTIKMLENPTRNKFIPEVLQKPTIEMLQTFDFVTYRVRKNGELVPWGEEKGGEPTKTNRMWREKMEKLQSVLSNLEGIQDEEDLSKYGNNSSYLYNLSVELGDVTKGLLDQFLLDTQNDTVKISTLNSEKLKVLDDFMKSYLASINGAQETMIDGNNVQLAQVGQQVASEISGLKSLNAVAGTIKKKILDFLNLDMAEPITVFSELGGTMEKLYWHLEKGKDVRDGHIFATEDAFSKAKEELNIEKNEPSKWETGLMSFKDGQLQLTPAQVMSLYAAYGRSQARHHIIFGGVMSSDEGLRGKDKKLKKVQTKPVHLTPKDVEDIVNTLTPEQKALADFMVDYMSNEVSDWGNRVSQKRWGIRLFTENHYFPIKTFDVTRPSRTMDENANASLFSLQNQGFTKPLQKDANNALVLEDIFKVFSDHVAKMAAYDGYVIPINDFMRVFNYAESQETFTVKQGEEGQYRTDASVKEQIQRVFGTKGTQYFTKFIKNVNEDFGEGGSINLIDKLFSNNKAQAVLANGRVVIQQPTAYPRAMEVIDGKYLVKALSTSPVGLKKKIQRSKSHNTLAKFKSKGYYETSIGQSMQQMITGTATPKDKVNEVAGALAGLMDDWTWSVIYQAAEYKVQAEQKKLEIDSKEYFDAVNKIANEAYIKTQVVDSVFTKSQMMRSRDTGDKMLTAFMAEPTKYYNMLHRGVFNMVQHGNKKAFAKAVYLFVVGQVINSVAQSAYDAWRDDDDEKDAMEKFLNALLGISDVQEANGVWATMQAILKANLVENLLPINLLPVVKEVNSALAGWDSKNMSTQAIYDIVGDAKKIVDWAEGKGTLTTYGVLNTVAHSLSLATGMPVSSALREVKDLYNHVNDLWDGTNLVKNEQTESAKAQIAKSDNIQETVKTLYQEKVQENLEKGKTQQEAEKAAKSSVGSAITNAYKNDLVEAKKNNMSEATSMKAEAIKGFTALGISQADANKRVEKWFK